MSASRLLLFTDAIINLALGGLLVAGPRSLFSILGLPGAEVAFYPSILGAVLLGIGVALLIECARGGGLGLLGAVSINLCGCFVLGGWLLFGRLHLPVRGIALLWALFALLAGVSMMELIARNRTRNDKPS